MVSNLRGAPGYVYPRRTLSPCERDFIRTHIRSIDRCMRPTRGTHVRALLRGASYEGDHASTACPRVGWARKFFDQPMIVVVNAMLAVDLRTSSIGFSSIRERLQIYCGSEILRIPRSEIPVETCNFEKLQFLERSKGRMTRVPTFA